MADKKEERWVVVETKIPLSARTRLEIYEGEIEAGNFVCGVDEHLSTDRANMELIVALHNAALDINPSNPMAVVRKTFEMFVHFRSLVTVCKYFVEKHPHTIGTVYPRAAEALAAITKPAEGG